MAPDLPCPPSRDFVQSTGGAKLLLGEIEHIILARYFPNLVVPAVPPNQEKSSWAVGYVFDQYLWQAADDAKHGVGVFFSFGASDGNPNPIKYAFLAGVGGKGVPGRADDSYGAGFARTQFSSAFVPFLRQQLGLGRICRSLIQV